MGDLKVTLTPARHWGARVLHDSHRGFGGFHIEYAGRSVFHCGDSAWFEGFTEIGERLPVEIALLPIGAYNKAWPDIHMNPEEAVRAHQDLKATGVLVPIHWATFRLAPHPWAEPADRLLDAAREAGVQIAVPRPGGRA